MRSFTAAFCARASSAVGTAGGGVASQSSVCPPATSPPCSGGRAPRAPSRALTKAAIALGTPDGSGVKYYSKRTRKLTSLEKKLEVRLVTGWQWISRVHGLAQLAML